MENKNKIEDSWKQKTMRELGFGEEVDRQKLGDCPLCGKHVDPDGFQDQLSRSEFEISGFCQGCQDKIFEE